MAMNLRVDLIADLVNGAIAKEKVTSRVVGTPKDQSRRVLVVLLRNGVGESEGIKIPPCEQAEVVTEIVCSRVPRSPDGFLTHEISVRSPI